MRNIVLVAACLSLLLMCNKSDISLDSDSSGHYETGVVLYEKKDYIHATQELKRAIAANDHVLDSRILLGNIYLEWGRLKEAADNYEHALRVDRYSIDALIGVARLYIKQNRIPEALKALHDVVKLDDYAVTAHYLLGEIYLDRNELARAEVHFRKVLEIEPQHPGAQLKLRGIMHEDNDDAVPDRLIHKDTITRAELAQYIVAYFNIERDRSTTVEDMIDIKGHKAREAILTVVDRGVMRPMNSRFSPNDWVKRGELAQVGLNLLITQTADSSWDSGFSGVSSPYLDVHNDHDYFNAVIMLTTYGVFDPSVSGLFEPSRYVSGEEVIDFITRLQSLF
ncbi:tetratricopeptide repeat protein [candidate division KSB1 bacterium]|nr:tetratricopeptide repeat protein [candidate division KSB1 bacterium]